ncbi:multidrug resistance-associated protein [Microthyrium microscopicum]|uniref:Multidrug resistance-associated protein n=1 Tax=Microthyrium microscopicum TaxID=703497 RepID=A0A6A6UCX9_9PEZI|nr:multidrug resistance-associated protein [Microthyrium microscopicum]
MTGSCAFGADSLFGPRVQTSCREFDFTLLFEDAIFIAVPAGMFLLLLPIRLQLLRGSTVKVNSHRLAILKLLTLFLLLALQLIFLVFQARNSVLHTKASVAAGILNIVATFSAACASFVEDQRAVGPSDILVLYFSVSSLLALPRLRTLWMIEDVTACKSLWTGIFLLTVAVLFVESTRKSKLLVPRYQSLAKEQVYGFWGRTMYTWTLPLFQMGHSTILRIQDIFAVDERLQGHITGKELQEAWETSRSKHRLLKATFKAYKWTFLAGILPRVLRSGFSFAQPFLINATIDYMTNPSTEENKRRGQGLIGAYVLVYFGYAISNVLYYGITNRFTVMVRSGLISMVYDHTISLKADDLADSSAITLMGTDVDRIVNSLRVIHELWAAVLEVSIAIWLLEGRLWVASLVPVLISLVAVGGMIPVSTKSRSAQTQWMQRVEKRLAITSSALKDMKAVQMLGLTDILSTVISNLRSLEVKTSLRTRKLIIWNLSLSNLPIELAPYGTFFVYGIISMVKKDTNLLAAQAFTSLALISLLTTPLLWFCQALPTLLQAIACFERIEAYQIRKSQLQSEISESDGAEPAASTEGIDLQPWNRNSSSGPLITLKNAYVARTPEAIPILHDIDLTINPGFTIIIGAVGSGKSTLMDTFLGGNVLQSGTMTPSLSRVAYCHQTPWIQNKTIRENITGTSEYDKKRYDFAVWACGLEADLLAIPGGDERKTGSSGIGLSGGQKQRIALARSIYSNLQVTVLDDVLSGLDLENIALITNRLFGEDGYFRKNGKSVILITNSFSLLPHANDIVILKDGRVLDSGNYADIINRSPDIFSQVEELTRKTSRTEDDPIKPQVQNTIAPIQARPVIENEDELDPTRRTGTWGVYGYYFRSGGVFLCGVFIATISISVFLLNFTTIWIQWWVEANENGATGRTPMYLGVYTLLVALETICFVVACWYMVLYVNILGNTSLNLHADLLSSALRAPFWFFQATDVGSITNRFSQDLELVDMMLPVYAINFVEALTSCCVKLVILCVIGKYLAPAVPILGVVLFYIQSYYLRTSRQVRLLDIEAKAPLYTHFIETIQGISTIRAFNWQPRFQEENQALLSQSQRPVYMLMCIQQLLALVLDLIVGVVAVVLIAIITSQKDKFSPASVGVALNVVLTLNMQLTHLIKMWTNMEVSIGAVARIQTFVEKTPTEKRIRVQPAPQAQWPSQGAVEFRNLTASFKPETPSTLKKLSLKITPGEKIAVCGASGSGKTSLVMALLQMMDITEGNIVVDGIDLATIECNDIRSSVNVVSQDPLFLPGTLRFNLDPLGLAQDHEIQVALEKVGLWARFDSSESLNMDFSPSEWSVGQRQLFALARAVLTKSSILILDEATSSVDRETEATMQQIIESEFAEQTVIAVIHRFRFINKFDRVALLRRGELLECDSPEILLGTNSEFKKLYLALQRKN